MGSDQFQSNKKLYPHTIPWLLFEVTWIILFLSAIGQTAIRNYHLGLLFVILAIVIFKGIPVWRNKHRLLLEQINDVEKENTEDEDKERNQERNQG